MQAHWSYTICPNSHRIISPKYQATWNCFKGPGLGLKGYGLSETLAVAQYVPSWGKSVVTYCKLERSVGLPFGLVTCAHRAVGQVMSTAIEVSVVKNTPLEAFISFHSNLISV